VCTYTCASVHVNVHVYVNVRVCGCVFVCMCAPAYVVASVYDQHVLYVLYAEYFQ